MSAKRDGGTAFPRVASLTTHDAGATHTVRFTAENVGGMSLRDYFAGQALVGHCSENFLATAMTDHEADLAFINAAAFAYRCADAMLAERAK